MCPFSHTACQSESESGKSKLTLGVLVEKAVLLGDIQTQFLLYMSLTPWGSKQSVQCDLRIVQPKSEMQFLVAKAELLDTTSSLCEIHNAKTVHWAKSFKSTWDVQSSQSNCRCNKTGILLYCQLTSWSKETRFVNSASCAKSISTWAKQIENSSLKVWDTRIQKVVLLDESLWGNSCKINCLFLYKCYSFKVNSLEKPRQRISSNFTWRNTKRWFSCWNCQVKTESHPAYYAHCQGKIRSDSFIKSRPVQFYEWLAAYFCLVTGLLRWVWFLLQTNNCW